MQDRYKTERALLYKNYIHIYRNDIDEVWYRFKNDSSFCGLLKKYEEHMRILRNMRITTQDGEQENILCALIRVLQKCLKEEFVDIERLNGWLTNLVPCP